MGKRILILCDAFDAPAYAPRVRYLCENLVKMGWKPFLFTEKLVNVDYQITCCPNVQIPYLVHKGWLGKIEWMLKVLLDDVFDSRSRFFYKHLKPILEKNAFDVVLASTSFLFPLPVAQKLVLHYNIPLVVDVRDIVEQWEKDTYYGGSVSFLGKKIQKILLNFHVRQTVGKRNRCLGIANEVTTISPWHVNFLSKYNSSVSLIYNGYDENQFFFSTKCVETFDIVYTGRMYDIQLRNPLLLLEAIEQLDKEHLITSENFKVKFFVDDESHDIIYRLFSERAIESYLMLSRYISTVEIPQLLQSASIVLVLSNKTTEKGPFGIMTTKFFEALGVEKPILCVCSDESCLAEAIREANAGLAATNVEEVKAFILEKYEEWKRNGYTRQQVNAEKKQLFSRQYQAKQFVQIFERIGNE